MPQLSGRELDLLLVLDGAKVGTGELSTFAGFEDARADGLVRTSSSGLGSELTLAGEHMLRGLKDRPGWAWFKDAQGHWQYGTQDRPAKPREKTPAEILARATAYDDAHMERAKLARPHSNKDHGPMSPEARELTLHAENNEFLWNRRRPEFLRNAIRKMVRGNYDQAKALTLWEYFADEAARSYVQEYGGRASDARSTPFGPFTKAMRREAAAYFRDQFEDAWNSGELRTFHPELFPKGATTMAKKKKSNRKKPRTAAQKKATKKLVAAAKKRTKKKAAKKRTTPTARTIYII